MIPKTRLQLEVWNLSKNLSKPVEQEPFVISRHHFYYTTHYKNLVCLECNHLWKPEMDLWKEEAIGVECPACNKKLNKITINNGQFTKIITYSVVQVVGRFQVIRYFSCWKSMYKNEKPSYHFRKLFEEWKDYDKNKEVVVGLNTTWTGDGFSSSGYEVRYNNRKYGQTEYDRFVSDYNCPGAEFLPRFNKYGLGNDFHNCDWRLLLKKLEMSPKVETLLKAKQKELLFYAVHKDERYHSYWSQIKILLRHKYKLNDAGIWYDYLQLLKEFGKDVSNPKFILPKNLKKSHNEYVAKKQVKIDKARAEREIKRQESERLKAEAEEALKSIKVEVFKDFIIKKGDVLIVPLIEDEDVKEEGKILKHCVHANGYHKKPGILLMSARVNGKRIETIEISLASYSIIQCRGKDNGITQYHNEIIEIVKRNMGKISRMVERQKKLKGLDLSLNKLQIEAA
ncbi:PcfJ domain-containing protein [Flavobacterium aestivum]|uniref:PcfJ domain-containing protein n=1 Tax=Flavobacterium aestivum TaxID=3003257 RepID=UPI0024826676|nr:PcfJ domain-containing protein [Flavobacterium aestivum]